jgi:hypothetical protein
VTLRRSLDEVRTILAACDAYDIVDFHSLGDYVEIPATAAWIREELSVAGCEDRPIAVGDAFPMPVLIGFDVLPFYPVTEETRDAARALLLAAANDKDAQYAEALAWLRAETAKGIVRKVVVSAGEGLAGINVGIQEDWKSNIPSVDSHLVNSLGSSIFLGLRDTTTTEDMPGGELPYYGEDLGLARTAQGERPAFAALRLALEKIAGFSEVERLNTTPGSWAYRFETPSGLVWVAWYDDGLLRLPGAVENTLEVELPIEGDSATVTTVPTAGTTPEVTTLDTDDGVLRLMLNATPVFVEAD